jgi:alanyl-tRNA synthetase
MTEPFMAATCAAVADCMQDAYPHLQDARSLLDKIVNNEETRFSQTLDHGLGILEAEIDRLRQEGKTAQGISGDFIFKLYDTYGFPVDIVRDIALEKGIAFDQAGFEQAMENARDLSRRQSKSEQFAELPPGIVRLLEQGKQSSFIGYDGQSASSLVEAIVDDQGNLVEQAGAGSQVQLFCPVTPFYAESGGQVGDQGTISWQDGSFTVQSTRAAADGLTLQSGVVEQGTLKVGQVVNLQVDDSRRATAVNHTATHLLQAAMQEILGDHVKQAGSLVRPDRLRFDFTHFSPVIEEEIRAIEQLVNEEIRKNIPVDIAVLSKDEAIADGATALFGEKYGDEVRVVSIKGFSKELCGGTHAGATGDIGLFKIVSETGIAAGVRRIEAVTGKAAVDWLQNLAAQSTALCRVLSGSMDDAVDKVTGLLKRQKELEKEIAALSASMAVSDLDSLLSGAVEVNGIQVVSGQLTLDSPKTLREVGDKIRDKMQSGVAVIGGEFGGKAALLALVSKDLTGKIKAGQLVKDVAAIVGGKGGGRPDMAQAGGPMADKLPEAVKAVPGIVAKLTGADA